jgi:hypothetical protein
MRDREMTFKERMQALGFEDAKDLRATELKTEEAYLSDVQNAREQHSNDKRVFWLGVAVLITFLIDMAATFALVDGILTGGIRIADVGIVAAVFGLLGTLNGYVAANAQQVIGYFFGSSRGSTDKTAAMSKAITQLGDAATTGAKP